MLSQDYVEDIEDSDIIKIILDRTLPFEEEKVIYYSTPSIENSIFKKIFLDNA